MSEDRSSTFWASVINHGISFVLSLAVTAVAAQILVRSFEGPQDVNGGEYNEKMIIARREWAKKHGNDVPFPELTSFEQTIMQDMIFPSQINASFDDIGGLDQTKRDLFETVLLPLTHPHLYQSMNLDITNPLFASSSGSPITSSLLSAPTGVLFYGPPGCGKTIMAKAIAESADCTFIQCNFATLISKYYGESEKFIASLFSVARKFSPSVIFIDEVDMYLGKRGNNDREQESRMKAQFLSLWDGLTTNNGSVLVLGATNRPFDLDEAILRRFSKQILFDLPTQQERLHILNVLLSGHVALDDASMGNDAQQTLLEYVSSKTNGFSGSDLKELSKRAAMEAVREHIAILHREKMASMKSSTYNKDQHHYQQIAQPVNTSNSNTTDNNTTQNTQLLSSTSTISSTTPSRPRPTNKHDFDLALSEVQPTGQQSMEYLKRFYTQSTGGQIPVRFTQPPNQQPSQSKGGNNTMPPLGQPIVSINVTPNTGPNRSSKQGVGSNTTKKAAPKKPITAQELSLKDVNNNGGGDDDDEFVDSQ